MALRSTAEDGPAVSEAEAGLEGEQVRRLEGPPREPPSPPSHCPIGIIGVVVKASASQQ